MVAEPVIPFIDLVGAVGFLVAAGLGIDNYRRTDVERPFWLAFTVTAVLGAGWLALVALEWLGIQSAVLNAFTTSLQAVVIGLTAVAVVGMRAVVGDLKRSRLETHQRAAIVSILSRVLRHNLRNDLNVIRGYTAAGPTSDAEANLVLEKVDDLLRTSEKARKLEQTVAAQPTYREVVLGDHLRRIAEEVAAGHPNASVEVDCPAGVTVAVMPSLETALAELIENALEHGGTGPDARVTVDRIGADGAVGPDGDGDVGGPAGTRPDTEHSDWVAIRVHDDGPGLPERERRLLEEEAETPLLHSSGVGLWISLWIVKSHDGAIEADTDDGGTTMTITLPSRPAVDPDGRAEDPLEDRPVDRYHAIFEHDTDPVLVLDDDRRILDANVSAGTLFGREPADLLGRPVDSLLAPGATIAPAWRDLEPGAVRSGTVALDTAGGDPADGGDTGRAVAVYVVKTDIIMGEHLVIFQERPGPGTIV